MGAASRFEAARPEVATERLMGVRRIDLARFGEQLVVVAQQVLGNPGDSDGKVPLTEQLDFNPDSFHGAPQKRAEATIRSEAPAGLVSCCTVRAVQVTFRPAPAFPGVL